MIDYYKPVKPSLHRPFYVEFKAAGISYYPPFSGPGLRIGGETRQEHDLRVQRDMIMSIYSEFGLTPRSYSESNREYVFRVVAAIFGKRPEYNHLRMEMAIHPKPFGQPEPTPEPIHSLRYIVNLTIPRPEDRGTSPLTTWIHLACSDLDPTFRQLESNGHEVDKIVSLFTSTV